MVSIHIQPTQFPKCLRQWERAEEKGRRGGHGSYTLRYQKSWGKSKVLEIYAVCKYTLSVNHGTKASHSTENVSVWKSFRKQNSFEVLSNA